MYRFSPRHTSWIPLLLLPGILSLFIFGCANRVPPGGGPYDDTPPRLIRAVPEQGALNVKDRKVTLYFDEYVTLKDISTKVIISPPQRQLPKILSLGKRVTVELEDTLLPQTTYTIDFTNSIVDNNEGNELENFSYAFSSGDVIDTMEISGIVLNARDLEPASNVMVGVHADSLPRRAFRDTTFLRMSRTGERAQFVIRNMKVGRYHVYALKENDGNYRYNSPAEGLAFLDSAILTTSAPAVRNDTIFKDSVTIDTIKQVHYTRFMPDDIVLRYFTASAGRQFLSKRERPDSALLKITFNREPDSLLILSNVGDSLSAKTTRPYLTDRTGKGEVLFFLLAPQWQRSERFTLTYTGQDSLENPIAVTDTLDLRLPSPKEDDKEDKEESIKDSLPTPAKSPFSVKLERKGQGGISDSLVIVTTTPIDTAAFRGISLVSIRDSVEHPVPIDTIEMLPGRSRQALVRAPLRYRTKYELRFDSLLFRDVMGNRLDAPKKESWTTKEASELSQLQVAISGVKPPFIFELLNEQDAPVRIIATTGAVADFVDLAPGKYYLRLVVDSNGNGIWDPGDFDAGRQPEMVYYSGKNFEILKNWKVKENWNPTLTPLSRQKPFKLIKNKPKEKEKIDRNRQREEEMRNRRGNSGFGSGLGGFNNMRDMIR